jgi:hypothetical protein
MLKTMSITRAVARAALKAKKQSPHIFFGAGLAGVVSGGVLACRATLKLEAELDQLKDALNTIKEAEANQLLPSNEEHMDARRLTVVAYAHSGVRLTRLYGPAIVLAGVGVACLTGSHIQLTRRNAAIQATLVAVQTAYDNYRERMKEELGEDREKAIFRNIDGLSAKESADGRDPNKFSPYARIFDQSCPNWKKDAELNRVHIQFQQNYANHLLNARGHVFLNEVYDSLGFPHTREGSIVGWILDGHGDNYIDFGMFDPANSAFINCAEPSVWLDFNVDGMIFDKI